MQTTTNYNYKVYEGDDLFNPLTVENANIREIDEDMKQNANNGVWTANHLRANTIHTLTRTNPDARMFTFNATSKFDLGDSFTVDGVSVTALMPNGAGLPDGVFVIGSTVLCSLVGTLLTIYSVGTGKADDSEKLDGQPASYYAKQSDMESTTALAENASNLSNANSQSINQINSDLSEFKSKAYLSKDVSISVTTGGKQFVNLTDIDYEKVDSVFLDFTDDLYYLVITDAITPTISVYDSNGKARITCTLNASAKATRSLIVKVKYHG